MFVSKMMQRSGTINALTFCIIFLFLAPVRCLRLNSLRERGSYLQRVQAPNTRLHYVGTKQNIATSEDDIDRQSPSHSKSSKGSKPPTPLKVGVLLLNLGGPETMEDVEGFLYNLFADPDIIRLPALLSFLQKPIAYVIAKRRAPKSSAAYLSVGGGSPIVKYTSAQAEMIEQSIRKKGLKGAKCYFAMRYWNPYTEEVLNQMHEDGINSMVILPLYPQYSISTSGSSLKLLLDIFENEPEKWGPEKVTHSVVPAWYYRPGYTKTMASMIVEVSNSHSNSNSNSSSSSSSSSRNSNCNDDSNYMVMVIVMVIVIVMVVVIVMVIAIVMVIVIVIVIVRVTVIVIVIAIVTVAVAVTD